jgi:hypothetical protein
VKETRQEGFLPRDRRRLQKKFIHLPNDAARRERRTLLLLSLLAFLLGSSGTALPEFSGGGITLQLDEPQAIYWLLAVVQAYFLAIFWLYSSDDFHDARKLWADEAKETMVVGTNRYGSLLWLRVRKLARNFTYLLWFLLEFIVPYLAAIAGITLMVYRATCGGGV